MTKIKFDFSEPIVLERRSKKKKKKKSSLARDLQKSEQHLTKAMQRSIEATDKGLLRYRKLSKKSANNSAEDAVVDFVPNVIEATAVSMRTLTLVPLDMMRAAYTPQSRRLLRRTIRTTMRLSDDYLP
jgi:hypothetical protein